MSRKLAFDRILFAIPVVLTLLGIVMIYSASAVLSMERYGSPYHYLGKQLAALGVGFTLMLWAMHFDYRRLKTRGLILGSLLAVSGLLMLALLTPSGPVRRWISLGLFSFQPSELAKPVLVLFLAAFLDRRAEDINDFRRTLLPCAVVVGGISFLIYMQPDLGTAASICLCAGLLLYLAGLKTRYLAAGGALGLVGLVVMIFQANYRVQRLMTFLHPSDDPLGAGFQIRQSLLSFGSGGIQGINLGEGRQKLFFLPEPHTDFIFSIVGEELGFLGAGLFVVVFGLFVWRGVRIAMMSKDHFGTLLAAGIVSMFAFQGFVNVGMTMGISPITGIPLPFVSYGGSSLISSFLATGVLLNIHMRRL